MLFVYLYILINCIILTLRNINTKYNLTQNIRITQSHYVKVTLGYVKFQYKNFNKDFNINTNTKCFFIICFLALYFLLIIVVWQINTA